MENRVVYTIGHSTHTLDDFRSMLEFFHINCIVDVRSIPASSYAPQFNQNSLKFFLKRVDISYLSFGKEFGARRYDCLDEYGNVDFEKAVKTQNFLSGVSRLEKGLEGGYNIALMCSESRPEECHRFSLVSRYLFEQGLTIKHILRDKSLKENIDLQEEMIREYVKKKKLQEVGGLFNDYDKAQQIIDAYRLKNHDIAFHAESIEEII